MCPTEGGLFGNRCRALGRWLGDLLSHARSARLLGRLPVMLLAGLLAGFLAGSVAGCGSKEGRVESGLRKGEALLSVADWDKASLEVRNVLQIDPQNAQGYFLSARIEEGRRDIQRAFGAYSKVLELAPDHVEAQVALARIYLLAGDAANAQQLTNQLLARNPAHPGGRTLQAALQVRRGDLKGAQQTARDVLADAPGASPDTSMLLAGLYANAGDNAQALKVVQAALAQAPQHLGLLQVAAQIAAAPQATGDTAAQAAGYFRRATELAPRNADFWNAWATHHARRDELEAAETVLRDAIRAQPDDGARMLTLLTFLESRRGPDAAIQAAIKAIVDKPREHAWALRLAELYRSAGRDTDADATLRALVERAGDAPAALSARNALAAAKLAQGQTGQAQALVDEVLKINPRDSAGLVLRGRMHLAQGRPRDAVIDLRAASKDRPGSAEIIGRLAQAHRAAGEPALAREVLAQAVKDKPMESELRLLLAADLIDARDMKAAAAEVDAAIKAAPRNLRAHDLKVTLALARKDPAAAEKAYRDLKVQWPDSPAPAMRLGQLLAQQRRFDAALKEYDAAIAVAPKAAEPKVAAVALLIAQRRYDAAAARIDTLERAEPRNVLPHQLNGDLAMARANPAAAQRHYERMIDLAPELAAGYVHAARALILQDKPADALALLQRGEKAQPKQMALPMARAEWLARLDRTDEAITLYEQLYRLAPEDDTVANNLGYLLAESRGDAASLQRALALTQRFAASTNAGFLDSLGWVHYRLGDYAQAVAVLERAWALSPDSPLLQLHLGLALHKTGQAERSRDILRRALASKAVLPNLDEARRIVAQG